MSNREVMQQALDALLACQHRIIYGDWSSDTAYKSLERTIEAARAELAKRSEMDQAIAAGDGTLHGSIDHWQERALKAEAELDKPAAVPDEAIRIVWTAAITLACNVITQRQDRLNSDDGPCDVLNEQGACREAVKAFIEVDDGYIAELRAMLAAAPQPPAVDVESLRRLLLEMKIGAPNGHPFIDQLARAIGDKTDE